MLKFDNKQDSMEKYLHKIYSQYTSRFFHLCKEHRETDGHTIEELKEICPEAYETFRDGEKFLEYTEKFLGYKYDYDNYTFVYIGVC